VHLPTNSSRYFFYGLLSLVFIASFFIISPFIGSIILAFLTAAMSQPVYRFFMRIFRQNETIASLLSMVLVVLIVVLPILVMVQMTITQLLQFSSDIRSYTSEHEVNLETGVSYINDIIATVPYYDQEITVEQAQITIEQSVSSSARFIADRVVRTGAGTLDVVTQLFVYLFLLFFFLPLQKKIPEMIAKVSPLDDELDFLFFRKANAMAQSMVLGTLVISIIQAVLGGIVLYFAGAPYVIFWVVLMTFLGIIPVVGSSTVLIPAGLLFAASGQLVTGIAILLISVLVISSVDNFLRPYLVSKEAELHPAFVLIGVLGGIKAFGLLGVIYGPVIMILLVTMLIVFQELKQIKST
jgi:predicted PurR-regulated permease PerM